MARLFGTPRAAENGILSAQEVRKLDGKKLKSSLRLHADYMPNTTHDPYTALCIFKEGSATRASSLCNRNNTTETQIRLRLGAQFTL